MTATGAGAGEALMRAAAICDAMTPDEEGVAGIDFLQACAVEALQQVPVMSGRCVGCAFTPGTEASPSIVTSTKAAECVERSHAFWCHMPCDARGDKTHLCAGWAERLIERAEQGDPAGTDRR